MTKNFTSKEIVVMRKVAKDLRKSANILREFMETDYSNRLPAALDLHAWEVEKAAEITTSPAPEHVLTDKQATVLDAIVQHKVTLPHSLSIATQLVYLNFAAWKYINNGQTVELTITDAGRAALKAHKASKEGKS